MLREEPQRRLEGFDPIEPATSAVETLLLAEAVLAVLATQARTWRAWATAGSDPIAANALRAWGIRYSAIDTARLMVFAGIGTPHGDPSPHRSAACSSPATLATAPGSLPAQSLMPASCPKSASCGSSHPAKSSQRL